MNKLLHLLIFLVSVSCNTYGQISKFGYISYSTTNIGDDIQTIAAMRFLPKKSTPIDRESIAEFSSKYPLHVIVNGWFMHTKNFWWGDHFSAPEISWPPSADIIPLFISFHLTPRFYEEAFSEEGIDYLRNHAPIGARDLTTLEELQKRDIPSYFSGCLTLTLDNPETERDDIIYAVDIPESCVQQIRSCTNTPVEVITHGVPLEIYLKRDHRDRLSHAKNILKRYQKAKCVVTVRLHAALPCLALGTPVLLLGEPNERFTGLKNLVRHCTIEDFLNGNYDFNFDTPQENKKDYLPIRDDLINRVSEWVAKNKPGTAHVQKIDFRSASLSR